jgi:hypothetical protein
MAARPKSYIENRPPRNSKGVLEMAGFSGVGRCLASDAGPIMASKRRAGRAPRFWFDSARILILAEMSHRTGFRLEAVARSAHAALRCTITISQNRGDASAREPRTYHGRGFSLLDARLRALCPRLNRKGVVRLC